MYIDIGTIVTLFLTTATGSRNMRTCSANFRAGSQSLLLPSLPCPAFIAHQVTRLIGIKEHFSTNLNSTFM